MSILVTGTPGSGKSTLTKYASSVADAHFVDADEIPGLCEWRVFETGEVMGLVTDFIETGEDEWYRMFGWYWRADTLKAFIADRPEAILCGSAENTVEFYSLFDQIFILKKDEAELLANLASPDRNNPLGQTPDQRKNFMNWQSYLLDEASVFKPEIIKGNEISRTYDIIINKVAKLGQ
jgi:hypothetical protein